MRSISDRATRVLLVIVALALWTNAVLLIVRWRQPDYSGDLESIESTVDHMSATLSEVESGLEMVDDHLDQIDRTLIFKH